MKQEAFDYVSSPTVFARAKYFYALIGGFSVTDPHFYFERAYYPAYEILLISSGSGWFRHGDQWLALLPGDCLLHDMRYPHAYKADPRDPFQMKYLVFDGHLLDKLWTDFFNTPCTIFHPDSPAELTALIDGILEDMAEDRDPERWEPHTSSLIYRLLLQCMQDCGQAGRGGDAVIPEMMVASQRYLNQRYLTIESMAEAAAHINLSYYHFIRQFKRYYGCTPKEYVLLKRIDHAKRLLLLSNRSITEVAGMSGFQTYNSFLHAFRQTERCSPMEYRKNGRLH